MKEWPENLGCLLNVLSVVSVLMILIGIFGAPAIYKNYLNGDYTMLYYLVISALIIMLSIACNKIGESRKKYKIKEISLEKDYENKRNELEALYNKKENDLKFRAERLLREQDKREKRMESVLNHSYPFSYVASLYADIKLFVYDETKDWLKHKKHPAISAAEEVKKLKSETKKYISEYREMLYKYEFLLKTFPELKKYIDDEKTLVLIGDCSSYDDFNENRDRSSDYVTKEEWAKLSIDERNQLALDRYKKKNKSNFVIGMEYEMYIDYILRTNGYSTVHYGGLKGLNDLGRDIIAKKVNKAGELVTYIIQCKNWSANKEIHENVICQLFGTTIEYKIQNPNMFTKIVPVLYSTAELSETAVKFANILGVIIRVSKKGEYPMIKCNIASNGEKIYHLPFDQQYYRAIIDKPGEFYAWTVKEATDAGFRRAFKYTAIHS